MIWCEVSVNVDSLLCRCRCQHKGRFVNVSDFRRGDIGMRDGWWGNGNGSVDPRCGNYGSVGRVVVRIMFAGDSNIGF